MNHRSIPTLALKLCPTLGPKLCPSVRSSSAIALPRVALTRSLVLLVIGGLAGLGCSVDKDGLGAGGQGGRAGVAGAGGTLSNGGAPVIPGGTGGILAPPASGGAGGPVGGAIGGGGSGGQAGSGGADSGSGGALPASGGSIGPGGGGAGGAGIGGVTGSGGVAGSGASGGMGGSTGSGGAGVGGADGACNATTCPEGCCNAAGRCVTGRTNARCGTAGAACAVCGDCFQCSNAGVCALVPSSSWEVVCASATIAATKPGGAAWDSTASGLPDAYCRSTLGGVSVMSTAYQSDTLSPVWGDSITEDSWTASTLMSASGRWGVSVLDEDSNGSADDPICSVTPRLTEADFAAGKAALPATESCLSLTLHLICAE